MADKEESRIKIRSVLSLIQTTTLDPGRYKLSESDTRAVFLEPLLEALGFNPITDIRREVIIPDNKERLDFQLLVDGQPRLIVEAKAFAHPLTAADGAQAVNYANVLGSQWAVATNGREWRLYNQFANTPAADKLVMSLDLAVWDDSSFPALFEQLWLTSKESCRQGALDTWLRNRRFDLAIRSILADPKSKAIGSIRRQLDDERGIRMGPEEIVAWITRNTIAVSAKGPVAPITPEAASIPPAASTQITPTLASVGATPLAVRATGYTTHTMRGHRNLESEPLRGVFEAFRVQVRALDANVTEEAHKYHIAYKAKASFVNLGPAINYLSLELLMPFSEVNDPEGRGRTAYAGKRCGFRIASVEDIPYAMMLIRQAFARHVGQPAGAANKEISTHKASPADEAGRTYWLIPLSKEVASGDVAHAWLDRGYWGMRKASGGRTVVRANDWAIFYETGTGSLAYARILGPADQMVEAKDWPESDLLNPDIYKLPLDHVSWISPPVRFTEEVRESLEAMRDRPADAHRYWGWLQQGNHRLSEADFLRLTRLSEPPQHRPGLSDETPGPSQTVDGLGSPFSLPPTLSGA